MGGPIVYHRGIVAAGDELRGGSRTDDVGEPLRRRIEDLESRLQERARFLAEREAKLKASEARVERLGALALRTAQTLSASTDWPVLIQLHRNIGPLRFRIRAGTSFTLVARLTDEGWEAVSRLRAETRTSLHAGDDELAQALPALLEAVIGDALEALATGRDGVLALASPASEKRSFWVPWQKFFGARAPESNSRLA
jgi:hypothetical protein